MWLKVCGITTVEDARVALDLGADAIGLNFVPASPRAVTVDTARAIARVAAGRAVVVAVVADQDATQLTALRGATGIDWVQLHGSEPPALLNHLLPAAYKAVRIADTDDVQDAQRWTGDRLLVDAKVPGVLGGSGHTFDWSLVTELARRRSIVLAGGLSPNNVAAAVQQVRPWGIDVASGVEVPGQPRRKDAEKMAEFVRAARAAAQ
jgi:phosphoribosylanthranilate isomerase